MEQQASQKIDPAKVRSYDNAQQQLSYQSKNTPFMKFDYAIASQETRGYYHRKINAFLDYIGLKQDTVEKGVNLLYDTIKEKGNEWFFDCVLDFMNFLKAKIARKEMAPITIRNYYKPLKLFSDMNNILINWKVITRGLPTGRRAAQDRAPTLEEIQKILEYPNDERIKPLVLVMVSSGIRLGAWTYLKWKHVTPIADHAGKIVAAKLVVYAGEPEQYYTFMTNEAYAALVEWMQFRSSYGEKITGESWLMRDRWRTAHVEHGARLGLAAYPKQLKINGIKSLFHNAYFKQGIRPVLETGKNRHEFKGIHGFRKFFKTVCEQVMKPANVELLLGHDLGISQSYYKPTESQLLEDYLKAADSLTMSNEFRLQKQVDYYKERADKLELMAARLDNLEKKWGI